MLKLLYNLETSVMICIIRVVFYITKIALSLRGMIAREYVNTVVTSRFFAVRDEFTSFNHFLDCLDLENIYKHAELKFICLSKLAF